ncbi:hypothetical protein SAMN05421788_107100 [Filimonas lacunae]|uniref:Uncharacterized protein n=1 Tax=Filimonas lacunae TaxID=477680 RepID=A0A173MG27_9BACT|nr:hypothetical protein [Filimonas lacunae]BAV06439.1 hypothetical protein FLA_2458 [Filimonas lacunae]SIT26963.1 hypothetical protein SAMN05421788_107100 [Filimonas lacunae]
MKYTLFLFLLLILSGIKVLPQLPGQLLLHNPENARIVYEEDTAGNKVPIPIGSVIKVWYRSQKVKWFSQPLARTDFNKHTYFLEARLSGATDSQLLFMRKPPPFPLGLFMKMGPKKGPLKFDTIPLSSITSVRSFSSGAMNAYRNASMMPTMSFVPTSINGFPMAVFFPSALGIVFTGFSDIMYPMHSLKKNKYKLAVETIPLDSTLFIELNGVGIDPQLEWDIDKHARWEKLFTRLYGFQRDSLLLENQDRVILSLTYGARMFPGYALGTKDTKTGVDITDRQREYGFISERFISQSDRIGIEILMQPVKASMDIAVDGSAMKLGAGSIISTYSFYKYGLGGLWGKRFRNTIERRLKQLNPHSTNPEVQDNIYSLLKKLVSEPKAYMLFGLGAVNANLFRVRVGQQGTSISSKEYSQTKFAIEGGGGVSSRLGKRLFVDMGLKYTWTSGYTPPLGGITSYNSWKLQFNVGWITNSGFARMKTNIEKQLN